MPCCKAFLWLQVGCGADELIDLLMRCVLDPGNAIVDCPPTFGMYAFDADVNDCRTITVPRLDGFRIDVQGYTQLKLRSMSHLLAVVGLVPVSVVVLAFRVHDVLLDIHVSLL
jgi:histidinol-phosphate/aromatic aminotransferase/cobyric acid decarboxylase-like protein